MKLSTARDTLFAQLQTVTRAASTRSAVQALSGVQILASGTGVELRATDMEIGLRVPLDGEGRVQVPGAAFVATIAKVARSASRDETRPVLTGILVSASGDELRMVATDSYRLSVKETKLDAPLAGAFEANVPARALQELTRIVQHSGAERISVSRASPTSGVRADTVSSPSEKASRSGAFFCASSEMRRTTSVISAPASWSSCSNASGSSCR